MKRWWIFILCILASTWTTSYCYGNEDMSNTMYQWRSHMAFTTIDEVVVLGEKVFALSSNALFSVNKTTEEIEYYTRLSGLSGAHIDHISHNKVVDRMLITYNDGRIDAHDYVHYMIAESIIALIWAAIGMTFWGGVEGLNAAIAEYGGSAAKMVDVITDTALGSAVAACVLVGVVGCAVTSGDTAFRCARLIVSDMFGISQKSLFKRVLVSLPLFAVALLMIFALPFQTIWSYFAWCNQTLAVLTLWCITVYLFRIKKPVVIGAVPALIMTYVCSSYIFISPMMCGMEDRVLAYLLGGVLTVVVSVVVFFKAKRG